MLATEFARKHAAKLAAKARGLRYEGAAFPGVPIMILSHDRILTTHVGSLPRNEDLSELLVQREAGEGYDKALFDAEMEKAMRHVVAKQKEAGIDSGNDGEQQRVGFQTYVPARMSGFGGESKTGGADASSKNFPELASAI